MGNISKTIRYFKRNGIKKTWYATAERLFFGDVPLSASECTYEGPIDEDIKFSILVPVYETPEKYLREMIDSVLGQAYGNFELILADASGSEGPAGVIKSYTDARIKYIKVKENGGISANTNVALEATTGDYCALLDHDDFLDFDALYENALLLSDAKRKGQEVNLIYSDEDKCNGDATKYFEPHIKENFNQDLILSNNYICHFTVIKTSLLKEIRFRSEYDGAQDYDVILRVIAHSEPSEIRHIGKILYHWRCHEESTAFNPASKEYAYEAGRRAIEDFLFNKYNKKISVTDLPHKGFYRVEWGEDIFELRPELGAVGDLYIAGNKITRGIYSNSGRELFLNMNKHFSGYMHGAVLTRDVIACDIRTVTPAPRMRETYEKLIKQLDEYSENNKNSKADIHAFAGKLSMEFANELQKQGLIFLFLPKIERR
ncbi:MAG: glycosyltransferase [Lachnospiraceae bacterium]|nr:glycosyltransferase [Lachnospiraceae bacterium]